MQGIFQKENTDKALKYGIYRHLPTYEKIIRNLVSFSKEKGGFYMLLTDKYADKIHGIITCYDRMIIQGYIPNWSHAETMTAYMKLNGIRIFDYPTSFSQPLTE